MKLIESAITTVNDALYGYVLIILLLFGGIYFTVRTKFAQFRLFGEQLRAVTEKPVGNGKVSSFQALTVSTASRVGTGNIIGVATAICIGGYGSVFWMWVIAVIGGASALIESTLAQIYKKRSPDHGSIGGPAYYIEQGLKKRWLGILFTIFLISTYGFGFNMLTSYNLQATFKAYSFYDPLVTPWVIGIAVALPVAYCLFGGGKRILKATGIIVPVMGVAYVLVAFIVCLINIRNIPTVITAIFRDAFNFRAIFGGFTTSCVMLGIRRGLLSNEAGVGSAPNASASAEVSHPVKQGLVQTLSVFIDTLVICTATAFMCMTSGIDISALSGSDGASYVQSALSQTLGAFGPVFLPAVMLLFAFTTLLGNLYYVEQCFFYLFKRKPSNTFTVCYKITASLVVLLGAILNADLLWGIADITMGAMALINIPAIILLGKYALRAIRNYEEQRREGKDPKFTAEAIGLRDLDYWK